jgi:GNAT superfamily N-acetyltransferase
VTTDPASEAVPPGFNVLRLDVELAGQLDGELEPHGLQVFPSARDFVAHGLGFGAVAENGVLACAATSYTLSSHYLEVAIATRPAFRGRGLAQVVGAALMRESLARSSSPAGAPRTRSRSASPSGSAIGPPASARYCC